MSNEISKKILEEMLDLAVDVTRFVESARLPRSVGDQLIRSITSVGANYAEAQDASSRRDFANKVFIAKKEASESVYWLKYSDKLRGSTEEVVILQDRTQRFVMILQKIVNATRTKSLQVKG